ncbi:putative membrane protein [Streptomyces venezuelae]|nr:putative membrane protein [Streptomyces venezuelae]
MKATVTPSTASPGADIDVRVQGCKGTTGAAKSQAFVADVELTGRDGGGAPLFGDTTIKSGLQDGTYKVTVTCDGHDHGDVGTVQVKHHQPTHRPTHEPTHHATPVAPVRAGGGGTAAFAAPAAPGVAQTTTGSGLGTPYTLLGLGMAALAAVAVAFRSSRRAAASGTDAGTGTGSSTGSD